MQLSYGVRRENKIFFSNVKKCTKYKKNNPEKYSMFNYDILTMYDENIKDKILI